MRVDTNLGTMQKALGTLPTAGSAGREITVVVGNPKPASRTRIVGEAVAAELVTLPGLRDATISTIELADVAGSLFDFGSSAVADLVTRVRASSAVIVASPVYKATYTGILKAFLDWFGRFGLAGVLAVPVMVGATPEHALAVEVHLRALLVEIGALVPTRGLFVLEDRVADLGGTVAAWREEAEPALGLLRLATAQEV